MRSNNHNVINTKIHINKNICGILSTFNNPGKTPAVLLLHGFASDKDEVNSTYKVMSESLTKNNIATLRIDFRCWGESNGKTEESTINKMVEDSISAITYLKSLKNIDAKNVGIIGFSLGAAIGMLTIKHISCKSLTLLSPALDLKQDFKSFLGADTMNLLQKSTSPLEINLPWRKINLCKNFYTSLEIHDPLSSIIDFTGHIQCIVGKRDFTYFNAIKIIENCKHNHIDLSVIDDADHIFTLSNGINKLPNVIEKTVTWLSKTLQHNQTLASPNLRSKL